jgi:hypothetical protein
VPTSDIGHLQQLADPNPADNASQPRTGKGIPTMVDQILKYIKKVRKEEDEQSRLLT